MLHPSAFLQRGSGRSSTPGTGAVPGSGSAGPEPGPRATLWIIPPVKISEDKEMKPISSFLIQTGAFLGLTASYQPWARPYPSLAVGLRESFPTDNLHPVPVCLLMLISVTFP